MTVVVAVCTILLNFLLCRFVPFGSSFVCCTGSIYSAGWDLRTLLRMQKIWWLGAEDQQAFVADRRVNIGFGLNSDIDKTKMDED